MALLQEIDLQKNYLSNTPIETIYFGGGTPSLLSADEINQIIATIKQHHEVAADAEITLEANPDDLSEEYLKMLKTQTAVNRLSIGIQSFSEEDLRWMNRAHNAQEALNCLHIAQEVGFYNLSIDLIYGSPSTSDAQWATNLDTIFKLEIPHISAYCMTVEPGTALDKFVKKGKSEPVVDEHGAKQFEYLMAAMRQQGYEHYEISNFAKPGHYAKHNSNYWFGTHYLGLGPSAHSFNGHSRQWNIANNAQYIKSINAQTIPSELETLTPEQRYNEYVMTALRTMWGADFQHIRNMSDDFATHFMREIMPFMADGSVTHTRNRFALTDKGRLIADYISMSVFV